IWTISENGVAVDAYAPRESRIPGVARYVQAWDLEVVLNGNTREDTLEQYNSMILETLLADRSAEDPRWPQCFPSSEVTAHALAPGLSPTFTHRAITHAR